MEKPSGRENTSPHICPHQIAFLLDNPIRRIFQNPKRMLKAYIAEGDTVMDLGCGPGFFTIDMAKLTGPEGKVIAVDLQEKMLGHVRKKAKRNNVEDRIQFFRCEQDRIGFDRKVDFILAYYMVHETPSPMDLLIELKSILNKNGRILIVEPKMHVSINTFNNLLSDIKGLGFDICGFPEKLGGRSVLISAQ